MLTFGFAAHLKSARSKYWLFELFAASEDDIIT
jgi:hypothetical protein